MNGEQEDQGHAYVGLAGGRFKRRYRNHEQSFRDESKKTQSELAKYVWKHKNRGVT